MTEKKLTGNEMFELVKDECEKYFEKLKKRKGVLFFINRNRKLGWYENGDEKKDGEYVGEWKDGKRTGQGTYTLSSGDQYLGENKDKETHDQGTITWSDGTKYVGELKDGNPNGLGTYTLSSGSKYVGEHKDGKKNGQGTMTFSDGRMFVGEYKDDKPWNGTGYNKNGEIVVRFVNEVYQ